MKTLSEIRFQDIDPDSGEITQDKRICICENPQSLNWVLYALNLVEKEDSDPNRRIYTRTLKPEKHIK